MLGVGHNIVLVGFMGTGKTTVGCEVARRLGLTFLDMDDEIVRREGKPIPRIFAEDGEPHFRAVERTLVRELAGKTGLVIGAGGGIVLNPDNVADFARTGRVVCLRAAPDTILRRVECDTNRPLLAGGDKREKIAALLAKRQALYDAIPAAVDTDALSIEQVVARVIALCA